MRRKITKFLKIIKLEAIIWIAGLSYLAFINPISENHFTICPLKNLGFSFCPGCGLGGSISHIFRLEFIESFAAHPLGLFAFLILVYRIVFLLRQSYRNYYNDFSQQLGVKNNG